MELNQGKNSQRGINVDNAIIESYKVQLAVESQTIIHCKIKAFEMFQHCGWANISPNTYLINRLSNERLKLIYAENIPHAPHRHFFRHPNDTLYFTLLFQKIPETWTTFCLYEETAMGDGFFVGEVPKNKSGIYRIRIN
jgi:hypothetical protein